MKFISDSPSEGQHKVVREPMPAMQAPSITHSMTPRQTAVHRESSLPRNAWLARLCRAAFGFACAAAFSLSATAQTSQPREQPVLRIETGMHTGVVWGISVDNANRYLVTASHDKTLRVWDLATLLQEPGHPASLLRTVRRHGSGKQTPFVALSDGRPGGATIAA